MARRMDLADQRVLAPRRWARLMPIIFVTYSLAYLDRVNYGFGAAGGLAKTLGISGSSTSLLSLPSLLSAMFFLGYFLFQIPGASYAEHRSARRLVFWTLIAWGILASLTGIITSIPLLAIDRFLLGVAESIVLPALLVFLTHWFTNRERSRANTFLILGNPVTVLWASILSGYLIQWLGWQNMFILEGIPSIIWAFIWLRLVNDHPTQAKWLAPEDAQRVERVLDSEQENLKPVKNYWEALRSPRVLILAAQYLFWSIGVYGFVLWLPSIVKAGAKQGLGITGLLSAIPYLLAIILMLLASYFSDRTLERKLFVWPFLLVGAIAFYASYAVGASNFWLSFLFLVIAGGCMYAPYGPFFAIIPEILPRNASGEAMALINSMGALGSFIGVYIVGWLNGLTGGPGAAFVFMACALVIAVFCTLLVRMRRDVSTAASPRRRDTAGEARA